MAADTLWSTSATRWRCHSGLGDVRGEVIQGHGSGGERSRLAVLGRCSHAAISDTFFAEVARDHLDAEQKRTNHDMNILGHLEDAPPGGRAGPPLRAVGPPSSRTWDPPTTARLRTKMRTGRSPVGDGRPATRPSQYPSRWCASRYHPCKKVGTHYAA
ncbi:unnamed protein product [Prorocentrum cordatum]|nr:unnamed protein product [Polarella glacialis]